MDELNTTELNSKSFILSRFNYEKKSRWEKHIIDAHQTNQTNELNAFYSHSIERLRALVQTRPNPYETGHIILI